MALCNSAGKQSPDSSFQILPAIDLKGGRCVRLRQGRLDDVTVYGDDPVEMAKRWVHAGATMIHVVDLDGAFAGHPVHTAVMARLVRAISVPVELGGGLRTDAHIREILACGVARAIIGTRALQHMESLKMLAEMFGDNLAVGIDARDGHVQIKGWVETAPVSALELAERAEQAGIRTLIYTDTAKDGMLDGVNTRAVGALCRHVNCHVIASGGVASVEDVRKLTSLGCPNLKGAIVGKALYEGRVQLPDLMGAIRSV